MSEPNLFYPKSLKHFKSTAQRFYSTYVITDLALKNLPESQLTQFEAGSEFVVKDDISEDICCSIPYEYVLHGFKSGFFSHTLALDAISWIFNAWENNFRAMIANELSCERGDVSCDVIGDLRQIRIAAAHEVSPEKNKLRSMKVITWLPDGLISLNTSDMAKIQSQINKAGVYLKPSMA